MVAASNGIVEADRPQLPATKEAARASLKLWEQRTTDAYRAYESAKRAFEDARGELAVVQDIAKGEYDADPPYATGSSGAWPLGIIGRYREISLEDWAR